MYLIIKRKGRNESSFEKILNTQGFEKWIQINHQVKSTLNSKTSIKNHKTNTVHVKYNTITVNEFYCSMTLISNL